MSEQVGARRRDITREVGVFSIFGKGLGLATGDFDADGDTDLYVANDGVRNFLYRNDGEAGFRDIEIRWLSGTRQRLRDVPADQFLVVEQE